jgi:hypothetical protein
MKHLKRSSRTILGPSLGIALVVGACVPALAQSDRQADVSFEKLNTNSSVASQAGPSSAGRPVAGLASLPAYAQGPISAALGEDDSHYALYPNRNGLRGENPRQKLVAEFTRRGAEVSSHNLRWGFEMRGYGYGDTLHALEAVSP